jgi:REP element-mobilizing transposase RayT
MDFMDPRKTPFVLPRSRGKLPHLHKPGGFYFVTFRLADAVLRGAQKQATADSENVDPAELMKDYDPPLTLGSCALRRPDVAKLVQDAILFFEGVRYRLLAWCVMPNHVHAVLVPVDGYALEGILHSWKSFSAKQANKLLQRDGAFWERESFDHLIRTGTSIGRFTSYTEENPVVAGLCARPEDWPYGSAGVGFQSSYWER